MKSVAATLLVAGGGTREKHPFVSPPSLCPVAWYTYSEVFHMDKDIFLQWMTQKFITIPSMLFSSYKQIGLKETELVALLHIQTFLEEGITFPTPELLSKRMDLSKGQCAEILGHLVRHQFISIEKKVDDEGIVYEMFSLEPLWKKLYSHLQRERLLDHEQEQLIEEGELFRRFEEEFSRPLSPIEAETISMWLDQDNHTPALIMAALREAVVSGKLNFRYIDRILLEWKRNGIKTPEQARIHGEKFRKYTTSGKQEQKGIEEGAYPGFQWLEQ